MLKAINNALANTLETNPKSYIFGEDIAFGGVFRCTEGLAELHGNHRVFNTPIAENGIVGMGIGMAAMGLYPIAEIQFADYVFPAFDQLTNEAAKYRYRSGGAFDCGNLTIRMPCGAVGHGGHYHSQSPESFFTHIPGLVVIIPSTPADAKGLLLSAINEPNPTLFFEPKILYRTKTGVVPEGPEFRIPIGKANVVRKGGDLTLVGWGAQVWVLLDAAERLQKTDGISAEVIDLRTLLPWDVTTVQESVKKTGHLVVSHEAPLTSGFGAEIVAKIVDTCFYYLEKPPRRVCGMDTPFPLLYESLYLPSSDRITHVWAGARTGDSLMKKLLSSLSESFGFRNPPEEVVAAESRLSSEDLSQIHSAFHTNDRHGCVLSYNAFSEWCNFNQLGEEFSLRLCLAIDKEKTNKIHYNDYLTMLGLCHQSNVQSLVCQLACPPHGIYQFMSKLIEWNKPTQFDWNCEVQSFIKGMKSPNEIHTAETFKTWIEMFPIFLRSVESVLYGFRKEAPSLDMFPRPLLQAHNSRCLLSEVWAWLLASNLRSAWRSSWELIYTSSEDGKSFNTFISKIRGRGVTLIVIEDENGYIFGGLASVPWEPNGRFYGDYSAFLFTLLPSFNIYKPSGSNENFQWCGEKFKQLPNGVGFGGQVGFFSLFLDQDFETGMSHETVTYRSPSLSCEPTFKLQHVECWLIERSEDDLLKDLPKSSVLDSFESQMSTSTSHRFAAFRTVCSTDHQRPRFGLRAGFLLQSHRRTRPVLSAPAATSQERTELNHVPSSQCRETNGKTGVDTPTQVADLEDLLTEKGACGVGFIASLKNNKTHKTVSKALQALGCMEHRGACSADTLSGDGAGIMTQIPWKVIAKDIPEVLEPSIGVGMVFFPHRAGLVDRCRQITEEIFDLEKFDVIGWRKVPIDESVVGRIAKATQPFIEQIIVRSRESLIGDELERELFIARKMIERQKNAELGHDADDFYFCTLSCRVIVYKGMLQASALRQFYLDLTDTDFISSFAVYHRRFSTNTSPRWPLAQPMRFLGHNGEINTFQGNLNWISSREHTLKHPIWKGREADFRPLCSSTESDSANLDRVAEFLVKSGLEAAKTVMVLIPEAYRNHPDLMKNYPEVVDMYEFYEGLQEGWDGPALVVFSDGIRIGARLDRNGLRPARYWETSDGYAYVASEVGVLNDVVSNAKNVVVKGRLGPGQMVYVDLESGSFLEHAEVSRAMATTNPYKQWMSKSRWLGDLSPEEFISKCTMSAEKLMKLQSANGVSLEDTQLYIHHMAETGTEPTYCMGDDIPLAVLSETPQLIYNYFKQRFAQVTNPPIDPLREGLVMSLEMRLGRRGNLLQPGPDAYDQMFLKNPIMFEQQLLVVQDDSRLHTKTFTLYFTAGKRGGMKAALLRLCESVAEAVEAGCQCIVLSDRPQGGMQIGTAPIPALLATAAVHQYLIKDTLRVETSIVVDTAQCITTHHLALLIGYGAHAVCPYLGFESCRQWRLSSRTMNLVKTGKIADVSIEDSQKNYHLSLKKGLLKIMSKMGISLLSCYHGAQIFEIYGLDHDIVDFAFTGSVSRIGGMSFDDLQRETELLWFKGFPEKAMKKLEDYGFIQAKKRGEYHANNSEMAKYLHSAIALGNSNDKKTDLEAYNSYLKHFENSPVATLRDCLEFTSHIAPISIEEVESIASIMRRFCTGGMSLGAISRETHETIAIAMNRIGGKSNSGEGGEDPVRWEVLENTVDGRSETLPHLNGLQDGDTATSAIKQVASGRFGVTPEFLVNANQLEIKIAQGAKPGEGGQLPGKKVSPYIAGLRRSKPGVPLISPPPHHDIYSIEDLAQLIYDLHMVNPNAKVSVKLVAEAGIGTVSCGVAKANADVIQISGHDGGTGASPISSIKHAGGPVEMGLAEVHQSLVDSELRERVILRVDGGVRTGRDVLMMAALGGDEFGFGTVAMIATGCIMARVCHTNNCPVGVATQREELRARFPGVPADLVNFFQFVAEEVRAGLAQLGLRSLDELIGHSEFIRQRDISLAKTTHLDLSFLTRSALSNSTSSQRINQPTHSNGMDLFDDRVLKDPQIINCIESSGSITRNYEVTNIDRAALGRIGGAIARIHGDKGFTGTLNLRLVGAGGQSFGCFLVHGMNIRLEGEANDYVGKGMAGGQLVIVPPPKLPIKPDHASIVGNTCLYGATGGKVFVNGRAGERFAVRNSLAMAVVEGTGDHCCEYMTGGVVVCLGTVGRNVGAGMTGGLAYFYDEDGSFPEKVNSEIVDMQRLRTPAAEKQLRELIKQHQKLTNSSKAGRILVNWREEVKKFWQLVPPSEKSTPEANPLKDEELVSENSTSVVLKA
eukprot:g5076.t1